MAVLFLMEAASKADLLFGTPRWSAAHTVKDALTDILKIANELINRQCTMEVSSRSTPAFTDNINAGWKKLTTSWLNDIISAKSQQEDVTDETNQMTVQKSWMSTMN